MAHALFFDLSLIIIIAVLVSVIMKFLKQPLIIGYIITGILVSPYVLNISGPIETFKILSEIGIALLLFIVGLNLNPRVIKDLGKVSLLVGFGQVIFTAIIGFLIGKGLGFATIPAIYIAIALTFSSTIIILKLLSDKNDLESLYGRIAVGLLLIQDLVVMILLMIIPTIVDNANFATTAIQTILKGLGLIIFLFIIGKFLIPKLEKFIAKSQELLFLCTIGWLLAVAALFHLFDFSIEIGALIAGITLSLSPYRYEISAKIRPLRDFFIILFFISLGYQLKFISLQTYLLPLIIFSLFVIIGNPIIVMIIMGLMGYTKRNSFLTGVTMAQISEFSIILIALGVKEGHINNEILSFIILIGLITIASSTYFILKAHKIYPKISKFLKIFERKGEKIDEHKYHKDKQHHIVLFGVNRVGHSLIESLKKLKREFLIIDYNPDTIVDLAKQGFDCKYGDANDEELLEELDLENKRMVISTIPDLETNSLIIHKAKKGKNKVIIAVSHQIEEAFKLYELGATYVVMPYFLGGDYASTLIERHGLSITKFIKEKAKHLKNLNNRKIAGHKHPKTNRSRN